MGALDVVGKLVKFAAISVLFPIALLVLSRFLYPIADQLAVVFTLNFGDVQWQFDRNQDPFYGWKVLFQYQWMYLAEGITGFAKNVFASLPLSIYHDAADTATNGTSSGIEAFEDN